MPLKQKTSMTSFDVAASINEMKGGLVGSRLTNIYSVGGGLLLRFKGAGEHRVMAVPGERVHVTRIDIAEKGMPSPVVMGIRKHVRDAVLESIEQLGFDRIAVFRLRRGGTRYSLVVEVLPRGVYALLDERGIILQVSEQKTLKDRVIRRGVNYQPPPGRIVHPEELDAEKLRSLLAEAGRDSAARTLARGLGYPGEVVEEALGRLGLEPSTPAAEAAREAEGLVDVLRGIHREGLEPGGFLVYGGEGAAAVTVVPFEPQGLERLYGVRVRRFDSFSEALDEYFSAELVKAREAQAVAEIEAEKAKLRVSLERARENLEKLEKRLTETEELMRLLGENMHLVYEVYECVRRVRGSAGWEAIPGSCPGVVDVDPSRGTMKVNIAGHIVELDVRLDPSRLLVELDRRMGELRSKIERGRKAVAEIEERLAELEKRARLRAARARALVRRKEWYEKYHWLVTRNGFLAIGGRDASQNESVVKRYLNERRIFMHADVHGAPAVVLFNEGLEPPEEDLRDAALLTAAYSKAWKGGVGAVDVYWAWGSQVSKAAPAGEYLARGAFMVYGKRNYIRGVELRLAIGAALENEAPLLIVGPEDLVKRRSLVYAVLVPGDEDPSKLASRLRRLFASKAPEEARGYMEALGVEEIRLRIPGRSRAIRIARGEAREPPRPIRVVPGQAP